MIKIIEVTVKRSRVKVEIEKDNSKILKFSVSLGRKIDGSNDVFTVAKMLSEEVAERIPEVDSKHLAKAYFEPKINAHFFDLAVKNFKY